MVESKYKEVIEACALEPDLKILSDGDMTEIGEKVNYICIIKLYGLSDYCVLH